MIVHLTTQAAPETTCRGRTEEPPTPTVLVVQDPDFGEMHRVTNVPYVNRGGGFWPKNEPAPMMWQCKTACDQEFRSFTEPVEIPAGEIPAEACGWCFEAAGTGAAA